MNHFREVIIQRCREKIPVCDVTPMYSTVRPSTRDRHKKVVQYGAGVVELSIALVPGIALNCWPKKVWVVPQSKSLLAVLCVATVVPWDRDSVSGRVVP